MNQEVKPLTAIIALAIFGLLLWGKFWAHGASVSVNTFTTMHRHPNGTAYIRLGNQLFGFNGETQSTGQIDLPRLGVDNDSVSDFAFFSNGDLLIRRHVAEQDFIFNLQRFFRYKNLHSKSSTNQQDGLFRCNTSSFECQPFSNPPINLNDAFALAVDLNTDRVFIADTSRHTLRLFSNTGEELDSKEGFFFPNQIQFQENKLYVADTNHHRLAVIGVEDKRFGEILEVMDTRAGPARRDGEVWPASFLLSGDQRWVRNAINNMSYGGIYIFENSGKFIKRIDLPKAADPFSLLQLGTSVLVSDSSQNRIYQFTLDGKALPDFQPDIMQSQLAILNAKKHKYQKLELTFTITFALFLIGGFSYAIFQQRTKNHESVAHGELPQDIPVSLNGLDIHWIKPSIKFKVSVFIFGFISLALLVVLSSIYHIKYISLADFWSQKSSLIILASLILLVLSLIQLRTKIGITDKFLIVVPSLGKTVICPKSEVVYSGLVVVAGKAVLNINQLIKTFSLEDIELWIYPIIKQGHQIEATQMQSLLLKRNVVLVALSLLVTFLVGLFLYAGINSM
jgi:hypothetical protein